MILKHATPIVHQHEIYLSDPEEQKDFDKVVLLLHGFQLDGYFMFKRFKNAFGPGVKVVAPNAPFLMPIKKENNWVPRYSWYFYDGEKKDFYVNYEPAALWLKEAMEKINPEAKETVIIGYSQGGYIAPRVAQAISETSKVIGLNSIFRKGRYQAMEGVSYYQINGVQDQVVSAKEAQEEFESQKLQGSFTTLDMEHPLNRQMIEKAVELANS